MIDDIQRTYEVWSGRECLSAFESSFDARAYAEDLLKQVPSVKVYTVYTHRYEWDDIYHE